MRFRIRISMIVVCMFAVLAITVQASAQRLITFDAPHSGTNAGQGTQSTGINLLGTITGSVTDNNFGTHGFVRTPDGKFTDFDVPGANPVLGCTCPDSINDRGVVTGYDIDTNGVGHGFLRTPDDGEISTFDVPEAGTGASQGTYPVGITIFGVVAGYYVDPSNVSHGFLRTADGKISTFDVPEAGTSAYQGTTPGGVNNLGAIAGYYVDLNYVIHGFLRTSDGKITTFDAPAAVGASFGTVPYAINDVAMVAGYFFDSNNRSHSFLRTPGGQFTVFEAPRAGQAIYKGTYTEGTFATAINLSGATTGFVIDKNAEAHSFLRTGSGEAITFDIPGQIAAPGTDFGSAGEAINAAGQIAGRWRDTNQVLHGFLRSVN